MAERIRPTAAQRRSRAASKGSIGAMLDTGEKNAGLMKNRARPAGTRQKGPRKGSGGKT
jgi:hypothetical protein